MAKQIDAKIYKFHQLQDEVESWSLKDLENHPKPKVTIRHPETFVPGSS